MCLIYIISGLWIKQELIFINGIYFLKAHIAFHDVLN